MGFVNNLPCSALYVLVFIFDLVNNSNDKFDAFLLFLLIIFSSRKNLKFKKNNLYIERRCGIFIFVDITCKETLKPFEKKTYIL